MIQPNLLYAATKLLMYVAERGHIKDGHKIGFKKKGEKE